MAILTQYGKDGDIHLRHDVDFGDISTSIEPLTMRISQESFSSEILDPDTTTEIKLFAYFMEIDLRSGTKPRLAWNPEQRVWYGMESGDIWSWRCLSACRTDLLIYARLALDGSAAELIRGQRFRRSKVPIDHLTIEKLIKTGEAAVCIEIS